MGSLFLRYPSRPAWSLRGSFSHALRGLVVLTVSVTPGVVSSWLFLTRLAWACCSCGIRHARRGLFAAPSHTPCVDSLFLGEWWLQRRSRDCRDRSVERDNTLFISIVLEGYSLYALRLAIPPPSGFHLSNSPNIKSHPRDEIRTEIASGMQQRTRRERGGIGQVSTTTTYPPHHPI